MFLLLLTIGFTGCIPVTYRHKYFTNCDDSTATGISTRLRMDGYLGRDIPQKNGRGAIFLYENGIYAGSIVPFRDTFMISNNYDTPETSAVYQANWGRFKLYGDTIKVQYFYFSENWKRDMLERWYVIPNDTTLSMIKEICYYCGENSNQIRIRVPAVPETYHFMPFHKKPPISKNSLSKKKWYKCK